MTKEQIQEKFLSDLQFRASDMDRIFAAVQNFVKQQMENFFHAEVATANSHREVDRREMHTFAQELRAELTQSTGAFLKGIKLAQQQAEKTQKMLQKRGEGLTKQGHELIRLKEKMELQEQDFFTAFKGVLERLQMVESKVKIGERIVNRMQAFEHEVKKNT